MDEILKWLAGGREYSAGVALYRKHGKDPVLRQAFAEEATPFKERKLQQVLEQLVATGTGASMDIAAKPAETVVSVYRHPDRFVARLEIQYVLIVPEDFWPRHYGEAWALLEPSLQDAHRARFYDDIDTWLGQGQIEAIRRLFPQIVFARHEQREPKPIIVETGDAIASIGALREELTSIADQVDEHGRAIEGLEQTVDYLESDRDQLEHQAFDLKEKVQQLQDRSKVRHRNGWPAELDKTLQALYNRWKPLFSERMQLMANLYAVAKAGRIDDAQRKEAGKMAARILDLRDACIDIYEQRDYYLEHKKLPEKPVLPDLATDPKKWPQKLQNHKRYLRAYRADLETALAVETPDTALVARLEGNIAKQEQYIEAYKRLMGED